MPCPRPRLSAFSVCLAVLVLGLAVPTSAILPEEASASAGPSGGLLGDHDPPAGGSSDDDEGKDEKGLPLEPERTLRIAGLREVTWMSVDVSPDGETIVFDLLGDLWTVPFAGGTAERLTSGMAFDGQPRFSPDGRSVVFTSDRSGGENLWVLELGEDEPRAVTTGAKHRHQSPEWTPDGRYVIASRGGLRAAPSKPWLYHVDGGSGIQLIEEPKDVKLMGAAFGDDPRFVWFARRTGRWEYNAQFPQYQLVVLDRDTGELRVETARPGSGFRPALSPDGRWLAYGTRHDEDTGLVLRDLRTGDERWLAWPVQHDEQEARASRDVLPGTSFTPDSAELVVSAHGRLWRFPVDGSEPVEIPFEADVEVELGPLLDFRYRVADEPTFTVRQIRDAVPSPDGRRLAFVALDRVWITDWPDGTPERLTRREDRGEHQPRWSPDGRHLAFVTWDDEDGGRLEVASARAGTRPRVISETPGYYWDPAWSPDGERVLALRADSRVLQEATGPAWGAAGQGDLVWVPRRGGEARLIAPAGGRTSPHFGPDPERIFLHHEERGLVSIQWDGTDERAHLKVVGAKEPRSEEPIDAAEILLSPDGERVVARVLSDLYLVEAPRTAKPTSISVADPDETVVPVTKLTRVGAQFPTWSHDGGAVHWSIGNAHFVHDLEDARRAEDEARAAKEAEEAEEDGGAGDEAGGNDGEDEREADGADGEDDDDGPAYEPVEVRLTVEARRARPEGSVVLRGARVVTMVGDEVIRDADVVVTGSRIAGVGPRGRVSVPEGARVIDVRGRTIVPGFVDTHAHVWPAWGIHVGQPWGYLANLAYGVTTIHDPQSATSDVFSYADLVETGDVVGPRVYTTGPGVFWTEDVKDLDHARDVLRRYSEYYGTKTIKMYVAGNRQQRQWILQAAREQELRPTTEGALNTKLNLTQIIDGYPGQEHNFPNFPIYRDVIELVAEAGTTYTPTLLVTYGGPFAENWFFTREEVHDDPKLRRFTPHRDVDSRALQRPWFHAQRHVFDEHARFVADLVAAGGRVGVGSHGQLQGLGYHWELWAMASGGLSNHDALRAATIMGAEALGFGADLGTIERGKLADLLVLDGNPLEDLRATNTLTHVMKNGELRDADTLDEVWPEPAPLERGHWWADEPERWQVP